MKLLSLASSALLIIYLIPANALAQNPRPAAPQNLNKMRTARNGNPANGNGKMGVDSGEFKFFSEQFADFRILRYQVPGFDKLTLRQKQLCYFLTQAALSGRDIFYDQSYKYNLIVRKTIEEIMANRKTDRSAEDWQKFEVYAKRVWFSDGIHHVYSNNKMIPECSPEWFAAQVRTCDPLKLPLDQNQTIEQFISFITPIIFDPKVASKRVNLDSKDDLVKSSAVNFYENISQAEVSKYYGSLISAAGKTHPSYGLNSKLVKDSHGKILEETWKVGGMYSPAITEIVSWLLKAEDVSENEHQKKAIGYLIDYYQTGDLKKFDDYSIEWIQDTTSIVDFVNGFIEVYNDPLGYKGSWEAYVSIKDSAATVRIKTIGDQAQWFEDHSPIMDEHKKKNVKGISAKVINVVCESGNLAPLTAIGINLPNADWIREDYGSKSVTIDNITHAYSEDAKSSGVVEEFYATDEIKNRIKQYGSLSDNLHTDMHEVIGHASGQLNDGVGSFNETLKNYSNTLEEARADLVALYYIVDPKLVQIGVMPTVDVGKAEYDKYITNGLMIQLTRLPENESQLEEAHMRNRQMIADWVYEHGKSDNVISREMLDGKTYFVINDYEKLRGLFGQLLKEVQRVKSEGDYKAGSNLVENYGVKVDPQLHKEILDRYSKLNIAPYRGFIQPHLEPVTDPNGDITDVRIVYPQKFTVQMMNFGRKYSFLPVRN